MRRLFLLLAMLTIVGCGSSSAPAIVATPPADIAGTYPFGGITNADVATFTNCTGDLAFLEGFTVADLGGDPTCVTQDPLVITQNGNSWQAGNQFVLCDTYTYTVTASGTINGDRIDGTITYSYNDGTTETQTITNGYVGTGGTVVARITGFTVSGDFTGSCSIVPPMELVYSQSRSQESGSGGGILGGWK